MANKGVIIKGKAQKIKATALKIAEFTRKHKAKHPVVLDVRGLCDVCDYFIICSGETSRQVQAIYDDLTRDCRKNDITVHHQERDTEFKWVLIDCFDIIIHIFLEQAREFYNLEYLWRDAKRVRIPRPLKSKNIPQN